MDGRAVAFNGEHPAAMLGANTAMESCDRMRPYTLPYTNVLLESNTRESNIGSYTDCQNDSAHRVVIPGTLRSAMDGASSNQNDPA